MTPAFLAPRLLPLLALPLIWWLIRRHPPPPRIIAFAAMRFLMAKEGAPPPVARPPWWLLLLRLMLAALLILALAHPVLRPNAAPVVAEDAARPLVMIVDTGWAAAQNWDAMKKQAQKLLEDAKLQNRPVALMATDAPTANLAPASQALGMLDTLAPHPWPIARKNTLEALPRLNVKDAAIAWISDGLGTQDDATVFAEALKKVGAVTIFAPADDALPLRVEADDLAIHVSRFAGKPGLVAGMHGENGFSATAAIGAGNRSATVPLEKLAESWRGTTRLMLEGQHHAAGIWLAPRSSGRIVIAGQDPRKSDQPLLDDTYYLHKALSPHGQVVFAPLGELPLKGASIVMIPDGPASPPPAAAALEAWVKQGGVLLRFAGPQLLASVDNAVDPLLPVRLLPGDRRLGGSLTWEDAQHLKNPPPTSPLSRLGTPPEEITVRAQALAAPDGDLAKHTWLALADGTPLITASALEQGWRILVHVPSLPGVDAKEKASSSANEVSWSNLPISGYFEAFLSLLPELGSAHDDTGEGSMTPATLLDAFGQSVPPSAEQLHHSVTADAPVSALAPPGLYRAGGLMVARNLGGAVKDHLSLSTLGFAVTPYAGAMSVIDLAPWCFGAALVLLLLDWGLRLLPLPRFYRRAVASVAVMFLLLHTHDVLAKDSDEDAAAHIRLAYVVTGDAQVDAASARGLEGLSEILSARTSFHPATPRGVQLGSDALAFYPLLYWPMLPGQTPPTPAVLAKLRTYLRGGGMVLLDTRGDTAGSIPTTGLSGPATDAMTALASVVIGLELGSLTSLPEEHTLRKSFYLLKAFPGRYIHPLLLVERENARQNDGVTPVVIGSNDWAGGWAKDSGLPPEQQELAWRFGVNLVMYALTGNYKADQIHLDTILKRLGKGKP